MTSPAKKDLSLHRKILMDIEGRIMSGEWAPGHRLPFEIDLATRFRCSRMTVNKVMTQLSRAGLIERRRKSGSFVCQPRSQSAILEIHDIETEVRALNLAYRFELMDQSRRLANSIDKSRLSAPQARHVQAITCLHFADGEPFCIEDRLINEKAVPDAASADFSKVPPGTWLLQQVPWHTAEHRICACSASSGQARLLKAKPGTACLVIERRTWSAEGSVTHVRFTYPGDRHALVARFTPESG